MRYRDFLEGETLDLPSIEVGDEVLVGKFKNRKATIKGFTTDDHNQPVLKTDKGEHKLFKPRLTKLEESASGLLVDVTAEAIVRRIIKGERDVTQSWVVRAYHSQDPNNLDPRFMETLSGEIEKAKSKLLDWTRNPTPLYRGMSNPPRRGKVGVHWSPEIRAAVQHGPYVMEMSPTAEAIDWPGTVLRRMSWSMEAEIMLLPNIPVTITSLKKGEEVLASNFRART